MRNEPTQTKAARRAEQFKKSEPCFTVQYNQEGGRAIYGQWECMNCAARWARRIVPTKNPSIIKSSAPLACACYCDSEAARRMEAEIEQTLNFTRA